MFRNSISLRKKRLPLNCLLLLLSCLSLPPASQRKFSPSSIVFLDPIRLSLHYFDGDNTFLCPFLSFFFYIGLEFLLLFFVLCPIRLPPHQFIGAYNYMGFLNCWTSPAATCQFIPLLLNKRLRTGDPTPTSKLGVVTGCGSVAYYIPTYVCRLSAYRLGM